MLMAGCEGVCCWWVGVVIMRDYGEGEGTEIVVVVRECCNDEVTLEGWEYVAGVVVW